MDEFMIGIERAQEELRLREQARETAGLLTELERIRDELEGVFETEDHDLQYAAEQTLRDLSTLIDRARATQA